MDEQIKVIVSADRDIDGETTAAIAEMVRRVCVAYGIPTDLLTPEGENPSGCLRGEFGDHLRRVE